MSFVKDTLKEFNNFRIQPNTIKKKCDVLLTGMSRLKVNEKFMKDVKDFVAQLQKLKEMPKFELNEALTKVASSELNKFIQDPLKYNRFRDKNQLKGIVPPQYDPENPNLVADDGADTPQDVTTKVLLNMKDTNQFGKKALINPEYTQIGIAQKEVDDENYIVMIFAKSFSDEEEKEVELPKGNLSELKKAFDLFDYEKRGKIRIGLTMDAMKRMKFDETDPVLFDIMNGLLNNDLVSWPKFATHVVMRMSDRNTDKGLRTIFDLFIDNPEQDTISYETFKRIIKELGANVSDEEARKILENSTEKGNEINFDDFRIFMKEK